MQGGDSSLEPGEVKTPPPGSSPATVKEHTPSRLAQERPEPPTKQLAKDTLAKALKTVSQLEAEACEEKVRAILELDAKRRKEEVEKRKLEAEKRRQSGETDLELERKRRAKEERKKLKKLKKAQKAADKALISGDEDNTETAQSKKRKMKKATESEESEGLCSSGAEDDDEHVSEKQGNILNSAIAIPSMPATRYPPHLPPPHILTEAFMGGFRPMNPFMRGPRPDFSHGRGGGFIPRGRGGMRGGRMPFQGFRPPFFAGVGNSGGAAPKFNVPHGSHGLQQRHHHHHHTPPPNRGHSPILPPSSDLLWTKCKPTLSYAFKYNKFHNAHSDTKPHSSNREPSEEDWNDDSPRADNEQKQDDDDYKHNQHEQIRKKDKKHKSLSKEKKKSKKHKTKEAKKSKRHRKSLSTSSLTAKHKKKSNKSSRRKIEKIRKSYGSSNRSTPTQQQQQEHSSEDTETTNVNLRDKLEKEQYPEKTLEEKMPNEEEIRNKVENIKKEKIETTELKIEDLTLKVKPLIIKVEPTEEGVEKVLEKAKESQVANKSDLPAAFDIFAESPPHTPGISILNKKPTQKKPAEEGNVTPPLPSLSENKLQKSSSLQNALEIQKRIDKLLQQDDIKLEAIEAAKEMLMKKTQKYQSTKEKSTPERELNKVMEQKTVEETNKIKITTTIQKEESSTAKEKPKAYKDKEPIKTSKDLDKEKEKPRDSSKQGEGKDVKHKDKSTISSKDKSKEEKKDEKKTKSYDKDKHHSEKDYEKDKTRKEVSSTYRNPFKRSISRDRFFGKIDSRRRTRTHSRERDFTAKRRLSKDHKRGDSSGYSSSRISSKRRISASSSVSIILNRSKSGERDVKGSLDSLNSKDRERKDKKREKTPELKTKRKRSLSPKRKNDKEKDSTAKSNQNDKTVTVDGKSTTPPPKSNKSQDRGQDKAALKETKKSKSPVKPAAKKRPLSFTQTEFLFPEEGNEDDFILGDDDETNDSFKNLKSPSDKEDSPDTDDYMDNWENDEDVDLDMNSNMPTDMSTPRKSSPDITEEDSFVTRYVNPSPPKELLQKQNETETKTKESEQKIEVDTLPLTPPLDLLKKPAVDLEHKELQEENSKQAKDSLEAKKPELFGMQELYDQFIKSVEASGVNMKSNNKEQKPTNEEDNAQQADVLCDEINQTQNQGEDPLSTSSTSTSSTTSSSSSSSSETNSSSSSSSSDSSSDDSNDGDEFNKSDKHLTKKIKLEEDLTSISSPVVDNNSKGMETITTKSPIVEREPRTPSPSPLQKNLFITQTPPTPISQKSTPKSDVAKDFKKLKNLEANLSRIQMMRANYDSNDEISEELHKMEMLFLQEKKIILQKYAKNTAAAEKPTTTVAAKTVGEFVPALPTSDFDLLPPPPPPEEPNKIFDANREAIKLTISPMKLPSKPAIFNVALNEETEKKPLEDKDEIDFTEKLVKPVKEVAIVKPMMETKESKESRTRDSHRHRRSPVYAGSRERPRSPSNYRERNRRSSSRNRFSPQRRGRGRSLSISPPRRGMGGGIRHGSPPRRGAAGGRFRVSNRRSRSRSPLRQFGNRRAKEGSPFRRKRGQQQDLQPHYKKFARHRGSRSRSPQARPRSPRTPPPRRRSYSPDPYSRSPLPFKPPSPPMRRSMSPADSPSSARRSRSPASPRRPRSPRSPRSPQSPLSPRSPRSPRSPDSPPSHRYDDHRYRRDNSFERHSSISPHPQYYGSDSLASGVSSQASSYYYNVSPNRISLDARINIVLNAPGTGSDTPPAGYEGYTNYAQYGGAAYMSIPPQPMTDPANNMGYYPNPYVPIMPSTHESHHGITQPTPHNLQHATQPHHPNMPPHLQQQPHSPAYSNIPTINSGVAGPSSPLPPNNFYYNDFNMSHQPSNPVLKELPKAPVAVQKGNVLEIVPSNVETAQSPLQSQKLKTSPNLADSIKSHIDKISSTISWKDEVNNRHVKSAVMKLNRGGENVMRSILKRSEVAEKTDKLEKKKVYFEDGIYPSRDSDDEDRKLIEYKIRKKVLRLRKKRGIDVPAARELGEDKLKLKLRKPKIDAALEKLPPPPPPTTMPPANLEQPIYLRPPTPVPLVYFHFDSVVHSMYVSQLEKPIPPRLLNPKCVPPGAGTPAAGIVTTANIAANRSPNLNLQGSAAATKKELTTLAALNRVGRNENAQNSPKMLADPKRESPNSQQSPLMTLNKPSSLHFAPTQTSPQMSPLHGPAIRHPPSPIGFVGMRINNFMRLPPSPLTRASTVPPHMQNPPPNMANLPHGMSGMRHPQYNMPPPNLMPPGMTADNSYNTHGGGSPYAAMPQPPPGFHGGYGQRPMNSGFFMGPAAAHTMHPPPPMPGNSHSKDKEHMLHHQHQHHQQQQHQHHHNLHPHAQLHPQQHHHPHHQQHKPPPPLPPPTLGSSVVAASPQAMIAPYNVKKTVN
ncbi:serine/arginine repetitive matrix protein 2 isoform X2 [Lucilia cuprina]|nr:serine/arginine repetitive matrix protein 2 isoform X2 [Lucilia cuprina]